MQKHRDKSRDAEDIDQDQPKRWILTATLKASLTILTTYSKRTPKSSLKVTSSKADSSEEVLAVGIMDRPAPRKAVPPRNAKPVSTARHNCDADYACDWAKYSVVVVVRNVAKRLHFCAHHFHHHIAHIMARGYEVEKL